MATVRFDEKKMRELIVYIAHRQADDPTFGKVKLAKLLFYSDFEAYARLGAPITGATYQKLPQGPAARQYMPIERILVNEGAIREEAVPVGKFTQYRVVADRDPHPAMFSNDELVIIDCVIDEHEGMTGTQISRKSHREVGWQVVAMEETIPYSSYLVSRATTSPELLQAAREVAAEHGWLRAA